MQVAVLSFKYKGGEWFWYIDLTSSRDRHWVYRLCNKNPQIELSFAKSIFKKTRRSQEEEKRSLRSIVSKDWDLVPVGMYCYHHSNGKFIRCPYWSQKRGDAWCELLQETDWLLWDQCKLCGVNDPNECENVIE